MTNQKKIFRLAVLVIFLMSALLLVPAVKLTRAQEEGLHLDVAKTITSVGCKVINNQVNTEVRGTYQVKNESTGAAPVALTKIRDFLSEFPSTDQPIAGVYALSVTDNNNFNWSSTYTVNSDPVSAQNPPFVDFAFQPINQGETKTLNYVLTYSGTLPQALYNSVDFMMAGTLDPAQTAGPFGDHAMFENTARGVCAVVTPSPFPSSAVETALVVPTPTATISPRILGAQTTKLPVTGENEFSWLSLLVPLGVAFAGLTVSFALVKVKK